MRKRSSTARTSVRLFSFHPLLAAEFERLLPRSAFRIQTHRLPQPIQTKPEELPVLPAAVYVLETSGVRRVDETLAETLVRRRPGNRVIVIAEKFEEDETFPLLALGVKGLIRYADVEESLGRALREVGRGGYWVPRTLLSRFVELTLASGRPRALRSAVHLSPREREVVDLLLENRSNKQIASALSISERTAKFHVANLLAKNGVKRRADLILLGMAPSRERPR